MPLLRFCFVRRGAGRHTGIFEALKREIRDASFLHAQDTVDTVYIGGGTPSSVDPKQIAECMDLIQNRYHLSESCEISMEANPGTLTSESLELYRSCGINRISMGMQAAQDRLLRLLGRAHTFADTRRAVHLIRTAGFANMNLDLMFALPTQTMREWKDTLETALAFSPEHLSAYALILEPHTPLYDDYGGETPVDDALDRAMYHHAVSLLSENGYRQYELSNFAKNGKACLHNLYCWEMESYRGFGLSAHSYVRGERFSNTCDLTEYVNGRFACGNNRKLSLTETAQDYVMLGLRTAEGIDLMEFKQLFHCDLMQIVYHLSINFIKENLLEPKANRLCLTEKGNDYANYVMRELMGALSD
jgi:oxygen-independent coproporphyrinogen-3 oxidase